VIFTVGQVGGAEEGSQATPYLVTGTESRMQQIVGIVNNFPAAQTTTGGGEEEVPEVGVCAGEGQNSVVWGAAFGNLAYCCGPNSAKQLGIGKQTSSVGRWVQINVQKPVRQVSAGSHHSLLCTTDGTCYSCGRGDGGQLGLGEKVKTVNQFQAVPFLENVRTVGVASSARRFENQSASYVLDAFGQVFAFGNNNFMKLGIGDQDPPSHAWTPAPLATNERFSKISAGKHHVLAIDLAGTRVFSWGAGDMGRLGLSDKKHRGVPTVVHALQQEARNVIFDQVIARETFSLAFSSTANAAYSWGFGTRGQLGRGNNGLRCDPAGPGKVVWCLETHHVSHLVANDDAVVAVRKNSRDHLVWGKLELGTLSAGDLEPKLQVQFAAEPTVLAFDLCGTHAVVATDKEVATSELVDTTILPKADNGQEGGGDVLSAAAATLGAAAAEEEPSLKKQRLDDEEEQPHQLVDTSLVVPPPPPPPPPAAEDPAPLP